MMAFGIFFLGLGFLLFWAGRSNTGIFDELAAALGRGTE